MSFKGAIIARELQGMREGTLEGGGVGKLFVQSRGGGGGGGGQGGDHCGCACDMMLVGDTSDRHHHHHGGRWHSRHCEGEVEDEEKQEEVGRWSELPEELLLDVIGRVDATRTSWPGRRDVVACASVCRPWRDVVIRQILRTTEQSATITFPISLKQPGPREAPIQCFIRRERASSTYLLYLGVSPALVGVNCKLLLAAHKVRHATSIEFIISLVSDNFSRASNTYVGKLRGNFLGNKFTLYEGPPPCGTSTLTNSRADRRIHSKQVLPRVPAGNYVVATISYELNVLRGRGPRRMHCAMHTIPLSAVKEGGTAPTPTRFRHSLEEQFPLLSSLKHKDLVRSFSSTFLPELSVSSGAAGGQLVLKNKPPRWHDQLKCWCLNFRGRVTVASVKNFQLVALVEPLDQVSLEEEEQIILQFGKIGKDIFTMDYCYPLSAFQAFAICLSSFGTKRACE